MDQIITFLNRKEGCGKTTLGLNLAAVMASEMGLKTAYLDYAENSHDTELILDIDRPYIYEPQKGISGNLLKEGKFYLFWAGAADFRKLVEEVYNEIDILIVDTRGLPPVHLLEISDRLLVPSALNAVDIKFANATVQWLMSQKYPAALIGYIVNKNSNKLLSAEDLKEVFTKVKISALFNYEDGIEESGSKRKLFYPDHKKSGFVQKLAALAGDILKNPNRKKHLDIMDADNFRRSLEISGSGTGANDAVTAKTGGHGKDNAVHKAVDKYGELKVQVHKQLFEEIDIRKLEKDALTDPEKKSKIYSEVKEKIRHVLDKVPSGLVDRGEREAFIDDVFNEVVGYGAIEELLKNPDITEIMVNKHDEIYIEKKGRLTLSDRMFTDDRTVLRAIERIVMPLGRRIDESMPYVDARLPDGSRVNAIIPPLAIDGPVLTIRKFSNKKLTFGDLINYGSVTQEAVDYLQEAVIKRKNILISGGTGSGKTTLLNVLSSFIPEDERIITIEDSAELRLPQDHVVRLEARPANIEGKGEVSIRDLVRNALRMRPDRIVVGECRGGETLDMLQAMNTGHEGSMTTVHANSPRDALSRLDVLVLMSGAELPLRAIREQVRSAIDVIIQQSRMKDGSRKITFISEVTGMEGDTILSHNVFEYGPQGLKRADRV